MRGLKAEWLIILILLLIISWQRACQKVCEPCDGCVVVHDTIMVYGDTTPIKVTAENYKPVPKKRIPKPILPKPNDYTTYSILPDDLPCDSAIIHNYFASFIYNDTVYNDDSTIVVSINDSLSENLIQRREVFIQHRKPLAIITPTLITAAPKKRIVLNAGLMLGTNLQRFTIEPTVAIQTKRDDIIMGGVDILDKPALYKVGYLMKISFRRSAL
jgi:hypothetical protein